MLFADFYKHQMTVGSLGERVSVAHPSLIDWRIGTTLYFATRLILMWNVGVLFKEGSQVGIS